MWIKKVDGSDDLVRDEVALRAIAMLQENKVYNIIYEYHIDDHGGNGMMLFVNENNWKHVWYKLSLNHCSECGPLDSLRELSDAEMLGDLTDELRNQLRRDLKNIYSVIEERRLL